MIVVEGRKMKRTFMYCNPMNLYGSFRCASKIISPGYDWNHETELVSNTTFHNWEEIFSDKDISPNLESGKDFIIYDGVSCLIAEKAARAGGDTIYRIDFYIDVEIDEESLTQARSNREEAIAYALVEAKAERIPTALVAIPPKKPWYVSFWRR